MLTYNACGNPCTHEGVTAAQWAATIKTSMDNWSADHFKTVQGDAMGRAVSTSDHDLLRGAAAREQAPEAADRSAAVPTCGTARPMRGRAPGPRAGGSGRARQPIRACGPEGRRGRRASTAECRRPWGTGSRSAAGAASRPVRRRAGGRGPFPRAPRPRVPRARPAGPAGVSAVAQGRGDGGPVVTRAVRRRETGGRAGQPPVEEPGRTTMRTRTTAQRREKIPVVIDSCLRSAAGS